MAETKQAPAATKTKMAFSPTQEQPEPGPLMGVRVRLNPSLKQEQLMVQSAGAARFAYNWGLGIRRALWAAVKQSENAISLHKLLNSLKIKHYPWMYEVSKCAMQEALRDLDASYKNWWRRLGEGKRGRAAGAPQFRSRQRDGIGSFRLTGAIRIEYQPIASKKPSGRNKHTHQAFVYLPRIGRVRLSETERFPEGAYSQVTVTEHAGHWYVSAQVPAAVKTRYAKRERSLMPVGGDLGLKSWMVLSDGTTYESPKALRGAQRKLRRLEREKSRRELGSKNRAKTRKKLQRVHERVANTRGDAIHKLTTSMATTNTRLVIEDLNAAGMSKNHALAQAIIDAAFAEIRRQLTYKCEWYGCGLELAPRFYPSTQTCSGCGLVKTADEGPNPKLTLKDRVYRCEGSGGCGLVLDRDENAALVLASLSGTEQVRTLVAVPNAVVVVEPVVAASCGETLNACGAGSSGEHNQVLVKLPAQRPNLGRKQELIWPVLTQSLSGVTQNSPF